MVIADTSVWIPFFNRPDSPEKIALNMLIDTDEVSLVGVVLAELLQGCRTLSERTTLSEAFLALQYHRSYPNHLAANGRSFGTSTSQRCDLTSLGPAHRRHGNLPSVQPGCAFQDDSWPASVCASTDLRILGRVSPNKRLVLAYASTNRQMETGRKIWGG